MGCLLLLTAGGLVWQGSQPLLFTQCRPAGPTPPILFFVGLFQVKSIYSPFGMARHDRTPRYITLCGC